MRIRLLSFLALTALLVEPLIAHSQEITRQVIASGGDRIASADCIMQATAGQAITGDMSGAEYSSGGGFWYQGGHEGSAVDNPGDALPSSFLLAEGRPNPSSAAMTLFYAVPAPAHVSLRLFDASGRLVKVLVDGKQDPGYHRVTIHPYDLASGIYFCRMEAPGFAANKRLVLLR